MDQSQQTQQRLESFWEDRMREAQQSTDWKNHALPLARVKKIMKADEDVRMISSEAPVVLAKASEMFILELTLRAWMGTEESKRKTIQKSDIGAAVSETEMFDFLVDIVPREEAREESYEAGPYYYIPQAQERQVSEATAAFVPWPRDQQQQHLQHQENRDM